MLFMIIIKGSKRSEAGVFPSEILRLAMDHYNDQLVETSVRIMAKGLHPISSGIRLSFIHPGEKPLITHGPFEDPNSLVAGFFLIEVESKEEAIYWALKAPDPQGHGEGQIELRQVY